MTELKLYGLTPEELEAARESLIALYELRDEYAKAKSKAATILTVTYPGSQSLTGGQPLSCDSPRHSAPLSPLFPAGGDGGGTTGC